MYFFNTGLDFQSCFFDTYKLYIYIYVAPFVSNIFTSKSVLTIAETHTLWPIPHQGHLTHHHLSWDSLYSLVFFSHFLPKKLMILRSFSSLSRWESVPGTLLVKKCEIIGLSDFFWMEFSTPQQEWQHKPENGTLRKMGEFIWEKFWEARFATRGIRCISHVIYLQNSHLQF